MKCISVLFCLCVVIRCEKILDAMRKNPNLSKFTELVTADSVLTATVSFKRCTVFAPTNQAMDEEKARVWFAKMSKTESKVADHHTVNSLVKKADFINTPSLSSVAGGTIYFTVKKTERDSEVVEEYFVNNAKIVDELFTDEKQHLYVIDEMLEPYLVSTNTPPLSALAFMEQPSSYNVGESVSMFLSRVKTEKLDEVFRQTARNTYFIPVDAPESVRGQNVDRFKKMNEAVIRGHIVPGVALFTRTAGRKAYVSQTDTLHLRVKLSIVNQSNPRDDGYTLYAESNIIHNYLSKSNIKGLVLSKIVRANIPIENGVIHLIETPLIIIDKKIWEFIENERDGQLMEFYKLLDNAPEFRELLKNPVEKTLFAPSNEALRQLSEDKFDKITSNGTVLSNVLKLHLTMKSLSTEDIVSMSTPREYISSDNKRNLYFRVVGEEDEQTLTVEGGGVNATAEFANIGATDGLIHIIDRILGMPFQTVYEKLKNDPSLRTTFTFSQQELWNEQLRDETQRFTFFAPNEEAWESLKKEFPSSFRKMEIGIVSVHIKTILNRHLLVGEELSVRHVEMRDEIHTREGIFKISKGYGKVQVKWEGDVGHIVRPDVQATNGVIHVIDRVMMKPRDLSTVTSAASWRGGLAALLPACCLLLTVF